MRTPIRRIVTAHDERGAAIVLSDELDPNFKRHPAAGIEACVLWTTDRYPPQVDATRDPVTGREGIAPVPNGTIFQIVDFPPFQGETLEAGYVQSMVALGTTAKPLSSHPMVHRTNTLDVAIVISGEVDMIVGESVTRCRAGDVIVQQATVHGWVNNSDAMCRIAFMMMDAGSEPAR